MASTPDDARYQEFKQKLRARRDELRYAVQEGLQAMGEGKFAREIGDLGDEGLAAWMQNLHVADLRHDVEELNDIEQALERIRTGDYGYCCDCGSEVAPARLRAYPTAKRCLECQEVYERKRRDYA
ncbi:TraR/DksA family transcriptional regulator [Aquisalimonas sp.]|uniref:TraR/DksA family transcriptional regulator n=1 Tax=Aquisalimonas sp. TaxID=1872621 RepID=UPI0025C13B5E|nr:TraR/DksA family transcriptional regulator [Aquisalimonas sp.]